MVLHAFVLTGLAGVPIVAIARRALPFVAAMIVVSAVVAFVPALSLGLLPR